MSRVHDALRKAEKAGLNPSQAQAFPAPPTGRPANEFLPLDQVHGSGIRLDLDASTLEAAPLVRFSPAHESHLIDLNRTHETPSEEFRTLRTRLNHLQTLQPLHTVVVTSPSPAEGKTFTAVNLALAQAHLAETKVLLADFDLRRPMLHSLMQIDRAPGLSDFLSGSCRFSDALRRVEGMNLWLLPAGSPVRNPLELLNLRQAKALFETLPSLFHWSVFDTPPLLFSADANLLATMADGTLLVVKVGSTTYDNVSRATQSLCENNVLGIVANGARASELYSKYTYYYSKNE